MAIIDIKTGLYLNDARDSYFFQDETNLYSPDNLLGYNAPGGVAINTINEVVITFTYTQLDADLIYTFTVLNAEIIACTCQFAEGSITNIFSELTSTVWPFTSANRFEITKDYGVIIPALDDMVYECSYTISDDSTDYTNVIQDLMDVATNCCLSKLSTLADINDVDSNTPAIKGFGYLLTAHNASILGNTDQANSYINKAKSICADADCNCGC